MMRPRWWLAVFLIVSGFKISLVSSGNPDAKRLYDDLLSNYNKLVRPVSNVSEVVTVKLKLKLSQLIAVNLKNQIMTTNLWVEQYWRDYKLQWDPAEYGGVNMLHVPSDHIWRPDIVLYNNADGNFEVTLATKATLYSSGEVEWRPPAIYHSSCEMDVEYFPFDEQTCVMKFGSWTYDGFQVDLRHKDEEREVRALTNTKSDLLSPPVIDVGIDLSEFYMSVEWDILQVPAVRNVKFYTCCEEPYLDITFNITMRRKTLFYTVNLIIPCMGISFLTILVFYLPSDSGEKVSLSINILLSLTVFFLLLAEIIPPTSLVVPLLGKFVLFTMILDTFSICVTVLVLNIHFRSPETHKMAPWVRKVFIHILPRLLNIKRPYFDKDKHRCRATKSPYFSFTSEENVYISGISGPSLEEETNHLRRRNGRINEVYIQNCNGIQSQENIQSRQMETSDIKLRRQTLETRSGYFLSPEWPPSPTTHPQYEPETPARPKSALEGRVSSVNFQETFSVGGSCRVHGTSTQSINNQQCKKDSEFCPEILKALDGILFIAEHKKKAERTMKILEDWKYVALVLDRLFLWIFTVAVVVGTAGIILQAPALYDDRDPIDHQMSKIGLDKFYGSRFSGARSQ